MWAIDDHHHLVRAELVQTLIRTPHVAHQDDAPGILLEQQRVVRGDETPAGHETHNRAPGILPHKRHDSLRIVQRVVLGVPHICDRERGHSPDSDSRASNAILCATSTSVRTDTPVPPGVM